MLTDFTGADRVYIACGYTDLRRGIDGLSALTSSTFQSETAHILHRLLDVFAWYSTLPAEKQNLVQAAVHTILEVLKK